MNVCRFLPKFNVYAIRFFFPLSLSPFFSLSFFPFFSPFSSGDTFHETIQRQIDFKWEAYNLITFITNFAREMQQSTNSIRFPYVSVDLLYV